MTATTYRERYVAQAGQGGTYDIIDTETGRSVGVTDEETAARRAQAMNALFFGNERRLARAALHNEVRSLSRLEGARRVADLVEQNPDCLRTMAVGTLLGWIHRVGRVQVMTVLKGVSQADGRRTPISDGKVLGSFSARERAVVAAYLREDRTNGDPSVEWAA